MSYKPLRVPRDAVVYKGVPPFPAFFYIERVNFSTFYEELIFVPIVLEAKAKTFLR